MTIAFSLALALAAAPAGPRAVSEWDHLDQQATAASQQGDYAKAEALESQALAQAKASDASDLARLLGHLAFIYRIQGRYTEAEPLCKQALEIRERKLGPDSPRVGHSLSHLALLYRLEARYAEAESLYKRALAIQEKALGPTHPDVARELRQLAVLYQVQGKPDQAEPLYRRALAIDEKAFGVDSPAAVNDRGDLALLSRPVKQDGKGAATGAQTPKP
jgi:tetratricopeptide (TPR) repeat protein